MRGAATPCASPASMPSCSTRDQVREFVPFADFDNARFPIRGALMQPRGGTVRHDAVVWGYARGADARGVDIIENCEVTGFRIEQGRIKGVETNRGFIGASKVGLAVAGSTSRVGALAGLRLPIESPCHPGLRHRGRQAADRSRGDASAPAISMSASPTKAASCSAAISTATIPTPSAAICR